MKSITGMKREMMCNDEHNTMTYSHTIYTESEIIVLLTNSYNNYRFYYPSRVYRENFMRHHNPHDEMCLRIITPRC